MFERFARLNRDRWSGAVSWPVITFCASCCKIRAFFGTRCSHIIHREWYVLPTVPIQSIVLGSYLLMEPTLPLHLHSSMHSSANLTYSCLSPSLNCSSELSNEYVDEHVIFHRWSKLPQPSTHDKIIHDHQRSHLKASRNSSGKR